MVIVIVVFGLAIHGRITFQLPRPIGCKWQSRGVAFKLSHHHLIQELLEPRGIWCCGASSFDLAQVDQQPMQVGMGLPRC
eukprot:2768804-Alexandrium_andersonii.AAC.1